MSNFDKCFAELMSTSEIQEKLAHVKSLEDMTGPNGPIQMMMRKMIEQITEKERDHHLGYAANDRENKSTSNSRNGYSQKTIKGSLGEMPVDIPRDRKGDFYPSLLNKYKQLDPHIEKKILNLYGKGMSTRDVTEMIGDIYGNDVSATLVSQVTNGIKNTIDEWQNRPLSSVYPLVFFDAIFFKTREDGHVISKASYTCYGINSQGETDILGIWISETEGARFWMSVFNDLKTRGIEDILIACVDGLKGFPEAIESIFPNTQIQLCIVHQIRNSVRYVASKNIKEFIADLKPIYKAPNRESAEIALSHLEDKWGQKYPSAVKSWREKWDHLSTFFQFPSEIRKMIYTTNIVENVHRQFRKVMKTKSSFPNDEALKKMLFLAIQGLISKTRKKKGWATIAGQLTIYFGERMKME